MARGNFTNDEIIELEINKYVKSVNEKRLVFTDEFKEKVCEETLSHKKTTFEVFEECGFDINIVDKDRMKDLAKKWRKKYKKDGYIRDEEIRSTGRKSKKDKELTVEEQLEQLRAENHLLKAENELLKKNDLILRGRLSYKKVLKWRS